jgi:hypothetical protein
LDYGDGRIAANAIPVTSPTLRAIPVKRLIIFFSPCWNFSARILIEHQEHFQGENFLELPRYAVTSCSSEFVSVIFCDQGFVV